MRFPTPDPGGRTRLHRAPPLLKVSVALGLVCGIVLLPRRPDVLYFVPAGLLAGLWALSRMPLAPALRRLLAAESFILGLALWTLFSPSAWPLFFATLAKSNLCVLTLLLLSWITPFQESLQALRRLRVPAVMLTILALLYRYLPVLRDEMHRMERARASRTFSRRRRLAWDNLSAIVGRLFVRSSERAERIYLAMCARGWK